MALARDFQDVLAAARRGSDPAWEALYAELAPVVAGYLRASAASEPDDLVGEVFLQVVRDLRRFEGGESEFRAWVLTIAHHRLVDDGRRRARRPVEPEPAAGHDQPGGDVEEEALERLGEERVRRALEPLSQDQRSVLLLRLIGDMTVEQVGRATGKRPGAVKALQRRALAQLRRSMAGLVVTL